MDELMVRNFETAEITTWDFPAIKAQLQRGLDEYASIIYTDDSIKDAFRDVDVITYLTPIIKEIKIGRSVLHPMRQWSRKSKN